MITLRRSGLWPVGGKNKEEGKSVLLVSLFPPFMSDLFIRFHLLEKSEQLFMDQKKKISLFYSVDYTYIFNTLI